MQNQYPQKSGISHILRLAFSYWSRTLMYQVLFSIVYLSVFFLVAFYFMEKLGIMNDYLELSKKLSPSNPQAYQAEAQKLAQKPEFMQFYYIIIGTLVFLFPLNMGLFKMYRNLDLGEKPDITDFFAGYEGVNFFIYTSFYLFWIIIYSYTLPTLILAPLWVLITLFSAPLMFFMDKKIFETISISFKALRFYFIEIVVCMLVATIFKYFGIFTFFGMFFTLSFSTAMIYALYQSIFTEKEEKND
ncbi:MAG: hypothetical protein QM564_13470 [Bergeyella sp.]